ncbi:hypothetical protein AQ616_19035 [Oceanobacillus sp. E9]|uniref:helix-turn-helix transcriptional regulator n=1 Tax=Oceanobacillus sp. E9 TaxID=1742575 RepID=UPI00084EA9F1|nr:helix-turn-helix transcriptional regulator [Oceanobacillus sp. E9]OEH55933.1 hypothetical protein AQ616_19035 [Oceanobacillus sp. E9]
MAYKVGRCLLQQILQRNQMTQQQLADRLGVTHQQINKYIHNRQNMSLQVAKNISVILDCAIDDLYEWVEVGRKE